MKINGVNVQGIYKYTPGITYTKYDIIIIRSYLYVVVNSEVTLELSETELINLSESSEDEYGIKNYLRYLSNHMDSIPNTNNDRYKLLTSLDMNQVMRGYLDGHTLDGTLEVRKFSTTSNGLRDFYTNAQFILDVDTENSVLEPGLYIAEIYRTQVNIGNLRIVQRYIKITFESNPINLGKMWIASFRCDYDGVAIPGDTFLIKPIYGFQTGHEPDPSAYEDLCNHYSDLYDRLNSIKQNSLAYKNLEYNLNSDSTYTLTANRVENYPILLKLVVIYTKSTSNPTSGAQYQTILSFECTPSTLTQPKTLTVYASGTTSRSVTLSKNSQNKLQLQVRAINGGTPVSTGISDYISIKKIILEDYYESINTN